MPLEPYQVLNSEGRLVGPLPGDLSEERLLKWYRTMWETRFFSARIVALQRQGRATTWIPSLGQEAASVGLATTLHKQDWLTASPREIGGYFLKGIPPAAITYFTRGYTPPAELFGDDFHCLPLTIVIGTQVPHSVGLAMAAKLRGSGEIVVGSCGDGATSEGDFSEALNFAGVFKAPVVLVVVNNGWAISVPRARQSAVQQIAERGQGFGVPARIVDGNDILAMYSVMQEATDRARNGGGPTLIEALTYRLSAHSTADDPTRYCPPEELALWQTRDPLNRFRQFLLDQSLLDTASDAALQTEAREYITAQVELAQAHPVPSPAALFDNVYAQLTLRLERQRRELM